MRLYFFLFFLLFFSCKRGEVTEYTYYENHHDTVRYVGKEQCRMCHAEIYDSYMQTGMGQSFHFAVRSHSDLNYTSMPLVYDSIKNLSYKPFWINDSLYLLEFRLKGQDTVHKLIKKITYKIGSGHHTNSHLFNVNGYIHQAPYTYYTQDQIADLPPGFENGNNTRFDRDIGLECMTCHNAYPQYVNGSMNKYSEVLTGIDCERCHGPGEAHVKQKLAGNIIDTSKYIDYSIVNPGKLPLDLQFDVCQRCHLQGTAVLAQDKTFSDFKPGRPLKEVMDVYLPRYENNDAFIMASHVDRLKSSVCFEESDMTCITCHNPHKSVSSLGSDYFDNKCMQCHDMDCKEEKTMNCVSCHMPKSTSTDIMHVTITDHKIGVHNIKDSNKGSFLGLVAINNEKPTILSRAQAYLKQYESFENNPIFLDSARYYLDKLDSEQSLVYFIQYYYLQKDYRSVVNYWMQSSEKNSFIANNEQKAIALSRVAESASHFDIDDLALTLFKEASQYAPYHLDVKLKLGVHFIKINRIDQAKDCFEQILVLNPHFKQAYCNLGYIFILENEFKKAYTYLGKAIHLDPDYLQAYENLLLLSRLENKKEDLDFYVNKILEIAPSHNVQNLKSMRY